MIWRLTYCNKKGVEARVDIIKGDRTSVEIVEGSGNPFTLSYKLDKTDKSGHIMTSSADIEIFETETFNIDDLKTSNETELKVEYFEDNVLTWSGFVLPDFFSREIGSPNIVRMTASDRLTALKGITLSDLPAKVSLRDLIELSLAQTGLSLGLASQIQINQGSTNVLDSEILSQRLTDTRGRSISCYDILMSIMVATNSTIRQREGQWVVYNKLEHELRTPTIFFDKVERGAIRTIQPVASSVGVYNEFGGGKPYPDNYDFSDGLTGWTAEGGFVASTNDKEVLGYYETYNLRYGTEIVPRYFVNTSPYSTTSFLRTDSIPSPYTSGEVEVSATVNAVGPYVNGTKGRLRIAIVAIKDGITLYLKDGSFSSATPYIHEHIFEEWSPTGMVPLNVKLSGKIQNPSGYVFQLRMYGSMVGQLTRVTTANFAQLEFKSASEVPKGNLYKTTQGSNFTKLHDVETVIFGDYIRKGLNGYFYDYPIDDTSNLYLPDGELAPPTWITAFDTNERPLLHHISRQKSRLFSVAHDILKANINVESFDPLAVFQDCKGGKYVVVSARFDFLRSEVDVELEQIAYDNTIFKRDFIYSYFGEGESNIKSIGGIAGGGGGTGGGGMTSEQLEMLTNLASWWKLDEDNDAIYSEKSVYSLKGISALGLGSGGGGGGGDFDRLDAWVDYNETKANWVLSALLGYDLHTRVNSLEASGGGSDIDIAITGSGNAVTGVSKSGNTLTFAKSSTFALSTQVHSHANKAILDQITQSNIDVLEKLSIVDGNIKVDATLWATGGISALGLGDGSSSGGGVDMLDSWANYTAVKANYYVPASLLVPFRSDTLSRLTSLESGSATSIVTTGSGNAITSLTKSGSVITATKGLTFALATHTHTIAQITGLEGALDSKATQSDIDTAIDGIEIGGRNLLIDSKNFAGKFNTPTSHLTAGQQYTFSIEGTSEGYFFIHFYPPNGSWGDDVFQAINLASGNSVRTFIAPVSGVYSLNATEIYGSYSITKYPKLEKGNKALDWTEAPEDQVSDWNETDVTSFSFIKNKPTTLAGYGITDAVTLNTAQTITGVKTFTGNVTAPAFIGATTILGINPAGEVGGIVMDGAVNAVRPYMSQANIINLGRSDIRWNNVFAVNGNFTGNLTASAGVTTPKVIFAAAGWSLEQVGTELQMKHNGVVKQRMLADGTILAVGGITALTTN